MSTAGGSRARNGMNRGQSAVTSAVGRVLRERGVSSLTMTELARSAGIARGTLYNHVRSRDDALRLYAESEALLLVARLLTQDPTMPSNSPIDRAVSAVVGAVIAVHEHEGVAVVRRDEPVLLMALLNPGVGPVWQEIRSLVRVLVSGGDL